jgi:hypothetical protein
VRRLADAVLTAQLRHLRAGLPLLEHPDDLLLRVPLACHSESSPVFVSLSKDSNSYWHCFRGEGQSD